MNKTDFCKDCEVYQEHTMPESCPTGDSYEVCLICNSTYAKEMQLRLKQSEALVSSCQDIIDDLEGELAEESRMKESVQKQLMKANTELMQLKANAKPKDHPKDNLIFCIECGKADLVDKDSEENICRRCLNDKQVLNPTDYREVALLKLREDHSVEYRLKALEEFMHDSKRM